MINKDITKKIAIIGTGFVGMSFAYALICNSLCDELVLIDINKNKAIGEAMDLNHGLSFAKTNTKIYAGEYSDCSDADLVVLCAGVAQKDGEDRLSLLKRNAEVFKSILSPILSSGFNGIFIVATNPVDIMTKITQQISGFDPKRVIGTGTTLDTARLRYLIGNYFNVDPKNVHAYVIGEHGDSEIVPWSQALIATKHIKSIVEKRPDKYNFDDLKNIEKDVVGAAQKIIEAKKATYYGIGMALIRIVKAIFGNEKSILTVSSMLTGEYSVDDIYVGNPSIIDQNGIRELILLDLEQDELNRFRDSCNMLKDLTSKIIL